MSQRILVVANKSWEADPLVGVLLSKDGVPRNLGAVTVVNHPFFMSQRVGPDPEARPRIEITLESPRTSVVEVWCIEDLMNPEVSGSSTLEKVRMLPGAFSYRPEAPDLVIAFGTAAAPGDVNLIGSVVVGSSVFLHDPFARKPDREGLWTLPHPDMLVRSEGLPEGIFRQMDEYVRFPAEGRFLRPPMRPADPPIIVAGNSLVALGNVNISNYDDYAWADVELVAEFQRAVQGKARIGSLETTHGVIRELSEGPFLFVSGIADQIGDFDYDVGPRVYSQNFVAAHNAGVTTAWLLPRLPEVLGAR